VLKLTGPGGQHNLYMSIV